MGFNEHKWARLIRQLHKHIAKNHNKMLEFFTTAAQERIFQEEYDTAIAMKQRDIAAEEKRTGRAHPLTAKGHVCELPRIFWVENGQVSLCNMTDTVACPTEIQEGGRCYKLDPAFTGQVAEFTKSHPTYKVTFTPSGQFGPCIDYCCPADSIPAKLEAEDGSVLIVEDEEKYSPNACSVM